MNFPFRLSAALARVSFLSKAPVHCFSPLATHFSPNTGVNSASAELEWHSPEECRRLADAIPCPVFWIGGTEPLFHPEIGRVVNSLVEAGRYVFVNTSGLDLRKRIHEFRPDSRLFFAVEFAGREAAHDASLGQPGGFRRALESIRTAKLSGFHVCAHVSATPSADICDIGELIEFLDTKDVEGFVVSSGWQRVTAQIRERSEELRELIRSKPWERFSRFLQAAHELGEATRARPELPGSMADAVGQEN
jgi:MoaA/NifB/PqqE/SkfB family radical SAM enzyme